MFTLNVSWKAIVTAATADAQTLQVGSLSGSGGSRSEYFVIFHKKENQIGVKVSVAVGCIAQCFR